MCGAGNYALGIFEMAQKYLERGVARAARCLVTDFSKTIFRGRFASPRIPLRYYFPWDLTRWHLSPSPTRPNHSICFFCASLANFFHNDRDIYFIYNFLNVR